MTSPVALVALKLFNISQNKPFLLSLFKARERGTLKLVDMNNAVLSIERFHFMFNAVCSLRPSGIESAYAKAARALIDESTTKSNNRQVIKSLLDMLIKRKPEFNVFAEKFVLLKFSNQELKNKRLIQYIFNRLELSYIRTGEYMPDSLTLEHVQPQSAGDMAIVGMIGNLLPLSKELNERAGNKSVKDKIDVYRQSQFALVQMFVDDYENKYHGDWQPRYMMSRAIDLCKLSYNTVWKLGKD